MGGCSLVILGLRCVVIRGYCVSLGLDCGQRITVSSAAEATWCTNYGPGITGGGTGLIINCHCANSVSVSLACTR